MGLKYAFADHVYPENCHMTIHIPGLRNDLLNMKGRIFSSYCCSTFVILPYIISTLRLLFMSQPLLYERQMCGRNLAASYVIKVLHEVRLFAI
jgi:hypothetical protein